MKEIYILNGPNLNLLGEREPETYGHDTLEDVETLCKTAAEKRGYSIKFFQSNREYELIDWIHEAREKSCGIVMNPAAYTHTSVAIHDALAAYDHPIIEVHISNVHQREAFRHHSYVSLQADGVICGCGIQGYLFGVERLISLQNEK